jgi:hypothetical protein
MIHVNRHKTRWAIVAALLLGACAQQPTTPPPAPPTQAPPPQPQPPEVQPPAPAPEAPAPQVYEPPKPRLDTMAEVTGDKPHPPLAGAAERFDCMIGVDDLHARIAFEARGGRVANFAYYSKWKPRTCAFDFSRTSAGTKWKITPEGHTRVHTPEGRFLIRTLKDAYVFEFEQVQRGRYCGMPGDINGTMTIKRHGKRDCSYAGIMDPNDSYLESLYKGRLK